MRHVGSDGNGTRLIADSTEGKRPTGVACYGVTAIEIGRHGDLMAFVNDTGVRHGLTSLRVGDCTGYLLCK